MYIYIYHPSVATWAQEMDNASVERRLLELRACLAPGLTSIIQTTDFQAAAALRELARESPMRLLRGIPHEDDQLANLQEKVWEVTIEVAGWSPKPCALNPRSPPVPLSGPH